MSMSAHTKGPWEYEAEPGIGVFVHDAEGTVAEVMCDQKLIDDRTALANARLIAAAPELYEALQGCVEHMEHSTPQGKAAYGAALTALAKARGES